MKKIMFNDKYGLTQAVLEGRKTMTRRVITIPEKWHGIDVYGFCHVKGQASLELTDGDDFTIEDPRTGQCAQIMPNYRIGEEVAVAESYRTILNEGESSHIDLCQRIIKVYNLETKSPHNWAAMRFAIDKLKGNRNKMFVKADLMPHRIRITDLKVERLQDISDEDCLKEGVYYDADVDGYKFFNLSLPNKKWGHKFRQTYFKTPRKAFAALIDKVSGSGTWERNPWVFAYTYELVK